MTARIIDGNAIAAKYRGLIAQKVATMKAEGIVPGLAVVIVGEDPASQIYVRNKVKDCAEVGIHSEKIEMPESTTQDELMSLIADLDARADIHGILVQFPLPKHLDENEVVETIRPEKDVDGFNPESLGRLAAGKDTLVACTPAGVMVMLDEAGVDLNGKNVVVVGRSNNVGKPAALLALERNATVTICHSRTVDLPAHVASADVVIAAVGRPEMIKGDWIREGAVVIDIGINRTDDGRLVGDVEFEVAKERAAAISPVPGGVGPMTRAMLLENTVKAAAKASGFDDIIA